MDATFRIAAIDLGTVSSRLVLAEVSGGVILSSSKHTEITDLGEGVDATGRFCAAAIDRVVAACTQFVDEACAFGAEAVCTTCTSAARDSENAEELLGRLRELGLKPQVISGLVEARLTFFGVAHDFEGERILVADSGGGSTELACGSYRACPSAFELESAHSLDIGCRRVTEKFLLTDPASASEIAAASAWADEQFAAYWAEADTADGAAGAVVAVRPDRLVAVGGTVTTLVAMVHELERYDPAFVHLHSLSLAEVESAIARMSGLAATEIATLPGIQPKRARVILAGALVIRSLMRTGGYTELTVSENSLLAGMAATINEMLDGKPATIGWAPELAQAVC